MNSIAFLLMIAAIWLLRYVIKNWISQRPGGRKRQKKPAFKSVRFFQTLFKTRGSKSRTGFSRSCSASSVKGKRFENFVTTLLPRSAGFDLREWRSDKFHKGVYAASNQYPDLHYHYQNGNCKNSFAVECKWRSGFYNERIQLAEPYQLQNYRNYSNEKCTKVFIALGIGGEPDNPAELFLIPLSAVSFHIVSYQEIQRFKKKTANEQLFRDPRDFDLR